VPNLCQFVFFGSFVVPTTFSPERLWGQEREESHPQATSKPLASHVLGRGLRPTSQVHARYMRHTSHPQARSMGGALLCSSCAPLVLRWCPPPRRGGSTEPVLGLDSVGSPDIQTRSASPRNPLSDAPPPSEDALLLPGPRGRAFRLFERGQTMVCIYAAGMMYCGADTPTGRMPVSTNSNVN
jgi:hypothetical protein